jgi:hypothetical protein
MGGGGGGKRDRGLIKCVEIRRHYSLADEEGNRLREIKRGFKGTVSRLSFFSCRGLGDKEQKSAKGLLGEQN